VLASQTLLLQTEQSLQGAQRPPAGPGAPPAEAVVGTVLEVGAGLDGVKVADRIVAIGSHAPVQVCDLSAGAAPNFAFHVREADWATAALAVRTVRFGLRALHAGRVRPGGAVAVLGLGLTGNVVAQIFQDAGAEVWGVTADPEAAASARACGLDNVVLAPPEAEAQALREAAGARAFRVAVAARPDGACLLSCAAVCQLHGQLLMLEPARDVTADDGVELLRRLHFRWLHLCGVSEWQPAGAAGGPDATLDQSLDQAFALIRGGRVRVDRLLDGRGGGRAVAAVIDWRAPAAPAGAPSP
jgi:NADPH:quinone reductase-like Zn-dependent oxidoreductase